MNDTIQNMIQTGQFGAYSPMQQPNYNPYMNQQYNNMVPINGYQQQYDNGYVFQPINNQQTYSYYQQPKYDYYNPYGQPIQQQYGMYNNQYNNYQPYGNYQYNNGYNQYNNYGYNQPYGYGQYNNYQPYVTTSQRKMIDEQVELAKMKYRLVDAYFNRKTDEEELDRRLNPYNQVNISTPEEIANKQMAQRMAYLASLPYETPDKPNADAMYLRQMSSNMHKELDRHSLCEFLENDLWKLKREQWIKDNIQRNADRDLSKLYSSQDYNELLNMHRSSNPYAESLLNTSRYDNNLDDYETGMNLAFDKERRKRLMLEGKVPTFISSEETQRRRHEFTDQILKQIYNKGGVNNV